MYKSLVSPILSRIDAEQAHFLSLQSLAALYRLPGSAAMLGRMFPVVEDARLHTTAFGLTFRNPIGMAAGFDKTGVGAAALACLGFGSVEIGTVTPLPQPGRPKPRMFRLPKDQGLINRLGFPNQGAQTTLGILSPQQRHGSVRGVNIGPNMEHVEPDLAARDCIVCLETLFDVADYFTINISSPNTTGLRSLQAKDALQRVLSIFFEAVGERANAKPVLLKLSPDLSEQELADMVEVASSYPIRGFIATNTTIERPPSLRGAASKETGGLSGKPLRARSTEMIRLLYRLTGGRTPIIGVGGVFAVEDVVEKLRAGASLVQLYTGMVYEGPGIARSLSLELLGFMDREGVRSVSELVGTE